MGKKEIAKLISDNKEMKNTIKDKNQEIERLNVQLNTVKNRNVELSESFIALENTVKIAKTILEGAI